MSMMRIATLFGILTVVAPASAPDAPTLERDNTQEAVPYEVRRQEAHNERMRTISERRLRRMTQVHEQTRRFECRLESILDGTLMVSAPYESRVEPVLLRFGHRKMFEAPQHLDRVLYQQRVYQIVLLGPDVPEWKVENLLGQTVELELEKFVHGAGSRVVRIREISSPLKGKGP